MHDFQTNISCVFLDDSHHIAVTKSVHMRVREIENEWSGENATQNARQSKKLHVL